MDMNSGGGEGRREDAGGMGGARQSGINGGNWDNCNSVINKIYFLNKKLMR